MMMMMMMMMMMKMKLSSCKRTWVLKIDTSLTYITAVLSPAV